jgi:fructose-bisphosphate aldolase class II
VGVSVEGELGCLGSLETGKGEAEDGHGFEGALSRDQLLTDPAEAADFVAKTKVDALAIAIGTSHGAYKFTRKPTGEVLAISRIAEIHKAIPNTHLVMHGSSSVPQEWLDMINQYGGAIPETYGVPVEEIQNGIKNGVRKVNIDTDNRLAFTAAVREAAAKDPANFDPRHFNKPARAYMKKVCLDRYQQFWCAGNASKIKQQNINYYAALYAKGALDPKTAVAV